MVRKSVQKFALVVLLMFSASFAWGQRGGTSTFGAADAHEFDVVNLSTLNPSFNFPAITKSQGALPGSIVMESPQGCRVVGTGTATQWTCGFAFGSLASFYAIPQEMIGMTTSWISTTSAGCTTFTMLALLGVDGISVYPFPSGTQINFPSTCGSTSATVTTTDGTGYTASFTATTSSFINLTKVVSPSGWTATEGGPVGTTTITDPFGNTLMWKYNATTPTFTDSLGAVTTLGLGNGSMSIPSEYTYTDAGGNTQHITFTSGTATTLQPTGQSSCVMTGGGQSVTPVTAINYPDGTSFGIGWQTNGTGLSGLINSITLRTGGQISYTYGTPINSCILWAYTSLTRTTPDGATTYSASTTSGVTTTTVLDPGKNKKVYTLLGGSGSLPGDLLSAVVRYQNTGTVASPSYTKISETDYCYNTLSCGTNANSPITQLDTYQYTYTPTGTQVQMSHDIKLYDSTYGLITSDANTDSITSQTITTTYAYGTYSSGSCSAITNTAIHDHLCTVTTKNGTTWLSGSTYTYNANGALTSSSVCLSSTCTGSSALTTTYTPNTTGTYSAIQDPNGQITNYTYGNCNSLMPTDVTTTVNSIAIDRKATWNCDAGLVTDTTDPNSNEADYTYDSMNRLSTYHDYMGDTNTTSYAYGTPTLDHVKVTDNIGVVSYQYNDGLGRPLISQIYNGTNYDTVSHTYGWTDSMSHALTNFQTTTSGGTNSSACTAALDTACTTVTLTALTNPIAGPYKTTDANSGTGTYAVNSKDFSFTAGPAVIQENTKVVQTEVDGFGRVTSTCALEASGGTSCGQTMGNSGILTSNVYSFATGAPKVVTTRGSQSHTIVADELGRTTSITLPETGSTARTFSYDSQSSSDACTSSSRTSNGDLLRNNLPDGTNYVCYIYDGLHRPTDTKNSVDSTTSPCKRFRYDATANGFQTKPTGYPSSGANIIGRLVEAETDDCTHTTALTDEWLAYDAMGRMTDMWQLDPNSSSAYIHTTVTYDADGNVLTLGGIPSVSTMTYVMDSEGRPKTATLGSSTKIVTGVTYDAASAPTEIDIGANTDKDTYSYDGLENMTQYKFSVGPGTPSTNVGVLTWSNIGSLRQLAITDGFNTNNTQTCKFGTSTTAGYDDVGRILDDDCGSVWAQTYSYDQYDNITKAGSISYNPTYSSTNNTDSFSTYDSNGNITKDSGSNTYTWNVYGQMASENSTNATYDAFGNRVTFGSTYEYLYSPMGTVGTLSSGSPYVTRIPLPGGGELDVDPSGGLNYYHKDWLGSTRSATNISTSVLDWSKSLSPYGDPYNSSNANDSFAGMDADTFTSINYSTPARERGFASSRWLSPDPAHSGWNAYAYVTDPNTQTDPSGLGPDDKKKPPQIVPGGVCPTCDRPQNATQEIAPVPYDPKENNKVLASELDLRQGAGQSQLSNPGVTPHGSAMFFNNFNNLGIGPPKKLTAVGVAAGVAATGAAYIIIRNHLKGVGARSAAMRAELELRFPKPVENPWSVPIKGPGGIPSRPSLYAGGIEYEPGTMIDTYIDTVQNLGSAWLRGTVPETVVAPVIWTAGPAMFVLGTVQQTAMDATNDPLPPPPPAMYGWGWSWDKFVSFSLQNTLEMF